MRIIGEPTPLPDSSVRRISSMRSLEQVTTWALRGGSDIDVVAQDEYSHDVLVMCGARTVLVFDTT